MLWVTFRHKYLGEPRKAKKKRLVRPRRRPEVFIIPQKPTRKKKIIRRPKRYVKRFGLSGVEIANLRKIPERAGVFDYDVDAQIDPKLTYRENKANIKSMIPTRKTEYNPFEPQFKIVGFEDISTISKRLEKKHNRNGFW